MAGNGNKTSSHFSGRGVFILVAILAIAAAAAFFVNMRRGGERAGGMMPEDTSAMAAGAALAQVKLPAALSPAAKLGKRVFDAKCATCHGQNAAGQNGVAPPLINQIYRPAHHGDMAFFLATQNGVRSHHWNFGNMPPVSGLTRADLGNIVAYVREVQRANGIN